MIVVSVNALVRKKRKEQRAEREVSIQLNRTAFA